MIKLRQITKRDLEWARKLRNKNKDLFFDSGEITKEMQKEWYKNIHKKVEGLYGFYVIFFNKKRVGTISKIYKDGFFSIGNIIIDKNYRRKGIFTKVMKHPYFFEDKLSLEVKPTNELAIKVYKKLGFIPEKLIMKKL